MSTRFPRLESPACDDRPLWDLFASQYLFPCVVTADDLGLFSRLAEEARTSEELAQQLEIGPRAAEGLLGVLTAQGYLQQHGGRFHLTELSRTYLLPESPYYYGAFLRILRASPLSWTMIRDAARNDRPVSFQGDELSYNEGVTGNWDAPVPDLGFLKMFTAGMHAHSFPSAVNVALRGDFSEVHRLLDVGGGSGAFCIALALRHPEMQFTVMELPPVCELAREYAAQYHLSDRIQTHAAEMFSQPWPEGHDAVFMSDILHDWDPPKCRFLLRKAFDVLPPGGRIYLHEVLLADGKNGPLTAAAYSLAMLMATRGKQFSAPELTALLTEAGFVDVSAQPGQGYFSLVQGRKPA